MSGQNTEGRLHILLLEDSADDRLLIARALRRAEIKAEFTYAATELEFRRGLESPAVDLILSDYSIPGFCGDSALKIAQALRPEVPFVFVSGTIGEDQAVESLKRGATDYALKDLGAVAEGNRARFT